MSELKVNTIQPVAGNQVTVQAQVLGVPGTDPNHFATVSQLGVGAGGISRSEVQELTDAAVLAANRYSDDKDSLQTNSINSLTDQKIIGAKNEAILASRNYTDSVIRADGFVPIDAIRIPGWVDASGNYKELSGEWSGTLTITGTNGIVVSGMTGEYIEVDDAGLSYGVPYNLLTIDGSNVGNTVQYVDLGDIPASGTLPTGWVAVSNTAQYTIQASTLTIGKVYCFHYSTIHGGRGAYVNVSTAKPSLVQYGAQGVPYIFTTNQPYNSTNGPSAEMVLLFKTSFPGNGITINGAEYTAPITDGVDIIGWGGVTQVSSIVSIPTYSSYNGKKSDMWFSVMRVM